MKFQLYNKQNQKPKIGDIAFIIYSDSTGHHAVNGRITKVDRAWFNLSSQNWSRKSGFMWYGEIEVIDDSRNGCEFSQQTGESKNCKPKFFGYSFDCGNDEDDEEPLDYAE